MANIANIFSALVLGDTLPNPILVRVVNVKYSAVIKLIKYFNGEYASYLYSHDFKVKDQG